MPIPPNTSIATATLLTPNVPDTTSAADVTLTPTMPATGFVSNCQSAPYPNALWYKYVVPAGIKYISVGVKGAYAVPDPGYYPAINIWTETTPGSGTYTQLRRRTYPGGGFENQFCGSLNVGTSSNTFTMSWLVVVEPGQTYYFLSWNDKNTPGTIDFDLIIELTHAPDDVIGAGDFIIPDDLGGFPAAVVRQNNNIEAFLEDVVDERGYYWSGEYFAIIQNGGWIMNHQINIANADRGVTFWGPPPAFSFVSRVNLAAWSNPSSAIDSLTCDQEQFGYCHSRITPGPINYLHKFDMQTGIKIWTNVISFDSLFAIGVDKNLGILYYVDDDDFITVHRYDVVNQVELSDFTIPALPVDSFLGDGFVLEDGTVCIVNFPFTGETIWNYYNPAGTLLSTIADRPYHRMTLNNTLTQLAIWEDGQIDYSTVDALAPDIILSQISVPAIISQGGGARPNSLGMYFGISDSCPLLVYPTLGGPVPPRTLSGCVLSFPLQELY